MRELVNLFREVQPTILALPDPLDKHPDHRAAGLFALLAVDEWAGEGAKPPGTMPRLLAYLVHWPAWPPGWDAPPPGDSAKATLTLPANLPRRGLDQAVLLLGDDEMAGKRAAMAKYGSQQEEMPSFLAAFMRRTEPFSVLTAKDAKNIDQEIERQIAPGGTTVGTPSADRQK
ncbi:MAG: PIG-L family deacetylase [Deltaproteobacteria bacterium]|nr:PIG-L family deacetylase [Deltaproteobacteria bacterium]